jgi:hypothetical protein
MCGMGWRRLGEEVKRRRGFLGFKSRREFAAATDFPAKTLSDLEQAKRTTFTPDTLARLEAALRWEPGSVQAVLAGGDPKPALDAQLADLAVDPRSLERYGDDLELLRVVADAGLNRADTFRLVLAVRHRRAELHQRLVGEVEQAAARFAAGDPDWADEFTDRTGG